MEPRPTRPAPLYPTLSRTAFDGAMSDSLENLVRAAVRAEVEDLRRFVDRRIAELTLKFRHHTLVGVDSTADARSSINGALDKLERQVVRLLERNRTRKRRPSPTSTILLNVLGAGRVDHRDHQVLETERIAIKPLTVGEAIEALESARTGVVVFRNNETERVNVIYRRPDGNLGLIEPES